MVELYWKVTIGYNPRRAARRARKARRVGLAGAELAALVVLVEGCAVEEVWLGRHHPFYGLPAMRDDEHRRMLRRRERGLRYHRRLEGAEGKIHRVGPKFGSTLT